MADIEKVIKCLELCRKLTDSCEGCPYENVPPVENCMLTMHDDALELLIEQEEEIENLKQTCQSMMEGAYLLKEQDNCENCTIAIEDRQPVVRCKDCKHIFPKGFCHKHSRKVADDFFCADGERR